jgi:hypothetical protein
LYHAQVQIEAHGNDVDEETNYNKSDDLEQSPALVTDGPVCVLCEFAMTILEKQIITNRTLDMVERGVEMICSYMPSSIGDKCIEFVQDYGDEIIDLIIKTEINPDQICASLALCNTKTWGTYHLFL